MGCLASRSLRDRPRASSRSDPGDIEVDRLAYPAATPKAPPAGQNGNRTRPADLVELKKAIARRELTFPKAIEQVARKALARPEIIALDSLSTIAQRCGVGTSTVSRLPRYFGFASFTEMRKFFQNAVVTARG
jgi:hypothetical protein